MSPGAWLSLPAISPCIITGPFSPPCGCPPGPPGPAANALTETAIARAAAAILAVAFLLFTVMLFLLCNSDFFAKMSAAISAERQKIDLLLTADIFR